MGEITYHFLPSVEVWLCLVIRIWCMSSSVLRKPGLSAPPSHGGCTSSQPHPQDRLRRRSPHLQSWPGRQLLREINVLYVKCTNSLFLCGIHSSPGKKKKTETCLKPSCLKHFENECHRFWKRFHCFYELWILSRLYFWTFFRIKNQVELAKPWVF